MSAEPADRWGPSSWFADFNAPERAAFEAELARDVAALADDAERLPAIGAGQDDAWSALVRRYEDVVARDSHLGSYVGCLASGDADDERFALAEGRLPALRPRPGDIATVRITHAAPHHLNSDELPTNLRRTRGGDAWEAAQGMKKPVGVGLGMPSLEKPAPLPAATGCS